MYHPATEINDRSAESTGWLSPKNCNFPQELGFEFAAFSHLTLIEFSSYHSTAVTKIELFIGKGKAYNRAKFQRVGFICMERANDPNFQDQELRSANLDAKGNFAKFRIHGYFVNRDNIFNQVGIRALTFWGKSLDLPPDLGIIIPSSRPQTGGDGDLSFHSDSMTTNSTNISISSEVLKKRNQLYLLKKEAERSEDYTAAQHYKCLEMYLEDLEKQMEQLQNEKQKVVKLEDYDSANILKMQIKSIYGQIFHMLDSAPSTLANNESKTMVCATTFFPTTVNPPSSSFFDRDNIPLWQSNDNLHQIDGVEIQERDSEVFNKLHDPTVSSVASQLPPAPLPYPPVVALKTYGRRYSIGQKRRISPTPDECRISSTSDEQGFSLNNSCRQKLSRNNVKSSDGRINSTGKKHGFADFLEHHTTLIFSVGIGILDFFTDIVAIYTYYGDGHDCWAFFSMSLVLLTSFMDTYTGYHEMECIGGQRFTGAICGFFHFLPAYAAFLCLKNYYNNKDILAEWAKADAARARFKVALWESMPQVVLQFHIIMIFWSSNEEVKGAILISCVVSLASLSYTFADFWNKKFSKVSFFPKLSKKMEWLWAVAFLLLSSSTVVLKTTSLVILSSSIRKYIFLVFGVMLGTRMALNAYFHGQEYFDKRNKTGMLLLFEVSKLTRKSLPNVLHDFLFVKQIKHAGVAMVIHTTEILLCLVLPAKGVGNGIPGGSQNLALFGELFVVCFSIELFLVFFIFRKFYKVGLYIPVRTFDIEYDKSDNNGAIDDDKRTLDYLGIEAMWTEKLTKMQIESGNKLISAAKRGYHVTLSTILASKCSGLINSVFGQLALEEGIYNRREECVKLLLEKSKDLVEKMGSIFYDSCLYGNQDTVNWCIHFLKSKTHQDDGTKGEQVIKTKNVTSIWNCMDVLRTPELMWLQMVLEYKDTDGPFGWTPLQAAARMGNEKVVKSLIEAGVDVNATTTHGSTALLLASYYGKLPCVELLIKAGTDEGKGLKGYQNKDALYWAKKKNHDQIRKKLKEYKKKSNETNSPKLIHSSRQSHSKINKLNICTPQDFYNKCLQCKDDPTALQNLTCILDHAFTHQTNLKELLEYKDIDGPLEWTPIHAATRYGYPCLLQLLLDYGADVTATNKNGGTALNLAIQYNKLSCAQLIIEAVEQKSDQKHILTKVFESKTPLQHAKALGLKDIITLLYTATNGGWNKAFDFYELCTAGEHEQVKEILLSLKAKYEFDTMTTLLEFRDMDGPVRWTPLHSSTRYGRIEVVKVLLEFGADVEAKTKLGSNALFLAAYYGQSSCAQQLINYGSNVATEYKGMNALDWARKRRFYDVVKVLENAKLKKPEESKNEETKGISPEDFYNACNAGQYKEVRRILKKLKGDERAKKTLFGHKAEPPLEWVPLHVAARMGHHKIVKLLLDNGAELEAKTHLQSNALLLAAYYGQPECVKILLGQGSDHLIRFKGKTPLEWAETKGHVEVIKLLKGKSTKKTDKKLHVTTNTVIAAKRLDPSSPYIT